MAPEQEEHKWNIGGVSKLLTYHDKWRLSRFLKEDLMLQVEVGPSFLQLDDESPYPVQSGWVASRQAFFHSTNSISLEEGVILFTPSRRGKCKFIVAFDSIYF